MRRMYRRGLAGLALAVFAGAGAVGYTAAMARLAPGVPPALAPEAERADAITVNKAAREMRLWRDGAPIRRYAIALGAAPEGHKAREGDERTPEGRYEIDWRNPAPWRI